MNVTEYFLKGLNNSLDFTVWPIGSLRPYKREMLGYGPFSRFTCTSRGYWSNWTLIIDMFIEDIENCTFKQNQLLVHWCRGV